MTPKAHTAGSTRAAVITRRGGPEVLQLQNVALPLLGPKDVLISVETSGVSFGDILMREGLRNEIALPAVPGYEVAGTVAAVGPKASGVTVGDHVLAWTQGKGGNADTVVLPDWTAVPYDRESIDPARAASLVLNYITAWQMLTRSSSPQAGDRILVHGGAGGVGSALLQLARIKGLHVMSTGGPHDQRFIESQGAIAVDYTKMDFVTTTRTWAPNGVVAIYDHIGGTNWKKDYPLLSPGGRLVVYGIHGGLRNGRRSLAGLLKTFAGSPRTFYLDYARKGVGVSGYNSSLTVPAHPQWYRDDLNELLRHLYDRAIEPVIADVYPLGRIAEAHQRLGEGVNGKIMLAVR